MDITFGFNGGQCYETTTLKIYFKKQQQIIGIDKVVSSAWHHKGSQMLRKVKRMTYSPEGSDSSCKVNQGEYSHMCKIEK